MRLIVYVVALLAIAGCATEQSRYWGGVAQGVRKVLP
jgi:hypothetical protein